MVERREDCARLKTSEPLYEIAVFLVFQRSRCTSYGSAYIISYIIMGYVRSWRAGGIP
jgi:hypothetical protein